LQIFINWKLNHSFYNRTMLQSTGHPVYYHKSIRKKAQIHRVANKSLPGSVHLNKSEKIQLINIAKATLICLHRETEPFTYADPAEIIRFDLERGLTVVLYGMSKERRLSIESYIGYLAFKNNIPVAYGGGWIFGHRCQFGINILPPFRGGESAFLFYQLLRVYKQYFGVERFVVKPYQFGKNNKEALKSGAFWFYYKGGFRPVDDAVKKKASVEWEKINNSSSYRTPITVLKKFIASNLQLTFKENTFPHYDAAELSKYITAFINDQFHGKRDIALTLCSRKTKTQLGIQSIKSWSRYEQKAFNEWSLIAQAFLNIENWSSGTKEKFIQLIKAKGDAPEKIFIRRLQQHKEFWIDTEKKLSH
ncbi:MAG TPA: hypothetical protein VFV31_15110, partial [Chitinophagaceae bacterium]|nr:hypothetical protein [Chitinophagaceae bacterium]